MIPPYGDPFQGFLGIQYQAVVYHSFLLEVLCSGEVFPRLHSLAFLIGGTGGNQTAYSSAAKYSKTYSSMFIACAYIPHTLSHVGPPEMHFMFALSHYYWEIYYHVRLSVQYMLKNGGSNCFYSFMVF